MYTTEEFKEIKALIGKLPPKGADYLQVLLLNRISEGIKENNKYTLLGLSNDVLKLICEEKDIKTDELKTKKDLVKAILG